METEQVFSILLSGILNSSNWFTKQSTDNILKWRTFRKSITENHISAVAEAWAKCPVIDSYLEFDDNRFWPDPWTLISDGIYCDSARALGIYYTLYYTSYPFRDTMTIEVYRDRKKHEYLNLVRCEGGLYTLNYEEGQVVNNLTISSSAELINRINHKNLPI